MYLQERFGFPHPAYGHVPLLLAPDGRRLSKRDKDLDLGELRKYLSPEQLLGSLAHTAGLLESCEPISARDWAADFSWERLKKEDIYLNAQELVR